MSAVIDANVLMRGKANVDSDTLYTVPEVVDELKSTRSRTNFDVKGVKIKEPSGGSVEKVGEKSSEIHSPTSEADEAVLALAMDLGTVVVTDDKALQNLASHLGIDFSSYMGEEIEEKRTWKKVCSNCGTEVSGDKCSRCGSTQVQRKPDQCSYE